MEQDDRPYLANPNEQLDLQAVVSFLRTRDLFIVDYTSPNAE